MTLASANARTKNCTPENQGESQTLEAEHNQRIATNHACGRSSAVREREIMVRSAPGGGGMRTYARHPLSCIHHFLFEERPRDGRYYGHCYRCGSDTWLPADAWGLTTEKYMRRSGHGPSISILGHERITDDEELIDARSLL